MSRRGPLIPGMREYDAPRRKRASAVWIWLVMGAVSLGILVLVGGIAAGIGPLRALGVVETPLTALSWRETADPELIQVAVALPPAGLCTGDEVSVRLVERPGVVEVSPVRSAPRSSDECAGVGIAGDRTWVDVSLSMPLAGRSVIGMPGRIPLLVERQ
jgi:hypothetical protein